MKNKKLANKLSKLYYNSLGRFIESASLYKLNLELYQPLERPKIGHQYDFLAVDKMNDLFEKLYEQSPGKLDVVKHRFPSGDYICFAYVDKDSESIAYARWLCKGSFYSATLRKELVFGRDEALTLDSYTHPSYRGQGLHRAMNIQMLNWLKNNTDYRYIFMVIKSFLPHLTKYPIILGYRKQYTRVHFVKGSFRAVVGKIASKIRGSCV